MRRASTFHKSLNRPKAIMGIEPRAFLALAGLAVFLFAGMLYLPLLALLPGFTIARMLTKKDSSFMAVFLRYVGEGNVYTSLPRPSDFSGVRRPVGWGRGLPW